MARLPKFTEADSADFIARYYTDQTSYVLKPSMTDGAFRFILNRAGLLGLARQQPRRELAVVVLIHYIEPGDEATAKQGWVHDLQELGCQRIVFLRGGKNMEVNGLPILESPPALPAIASR